MFKKVVVDKIGVDALFEDPVVVLTDEDKKNMLIIKIGPFEAMAIALGIEKVSIDRPLTHDLLVNLLKTLNVELIKVIIDDLKDGIYYAKLLLKKDSEIIEVDARPSDSIAIAVRLDVPIYASEHLLMPLPQELKVDGKDHVEDITEVKEDSYKRELSLSDEDEEKRRFREFLENLKPSDFLKDMDDE